MKHGYTDFQLLVHALPEHYNVALTGGRGGAKSTAFAQAIRNRAIRYGKDARILYVRQGPYASFGDFIATCDKLFDETWGRSAHKLDRGSLGWTWHNPTGALIQLGILPDGAQGRKYYEKRYQGNSFTDIIVDEAQQFARPENIDLLGSNMRGPIPCRRMLGANPGGIGHQWLAERYVFNGKGNWLPFEIARDLRIRGEIVHTKQTWINCPSTYLDNPFNGPDYLDRLAQSCGNDPELLDAWIGGNWKISRGAFFAAVLDNPYIEVTWPTPDQWAGWSSLGWRFWLSHDHGTAAPAVTYVWARSPGADGPDGLYYPRESCVLLDEFAAAKAGNLAEGWGWTADQLAVPIKEMAARWLIPARGVADDACFGHTGHKAGTIADEYARAGVVWKQARKGLRPPRHLKLKRLLRAAGNIEQPGLYISTRCMYWWSTVPYLIHDPRNREDVQKCDTDHGLDASEYGLDGDYKGTGFMSTSA